LISVSAYIIGSCCRHGDPQPKLVLANCRELSCDDTGACRLTLEDIPRSEVGVKYLT
jgi:hypothetical protein